MPNFYEEEQERIRIRREEMMRQIERTKRTIANPNPYNTDYGAYKPPTTSKKTKIKKPKKKKEEKKETTGRSFGGFFDQMKDRVYGEVDRFQDFVGDVKDNDGLDWGDVKDIGKYVAGSKPLSGQFYRGALDPDYADKNPNNFAAQFGANYKAGVGDVIKGAGDTTEWLGAKMDSELLQNSGKGWSEFAQDKLIKDFEKPYDKEFKWSSLADPDFYSSSFARSVPFTLSMIIPGTLGFKAAGTAGNAVANMTKFGTFGKNVVRNLVQGAVGSAATAPFEAMFEAGNVFKEAQKRGMSEQEADAAANDVFVKNLAALGISNIPELAFALSGFKGAGSGLKGIATGAGKVLGTAGIEGAQEVVQEGISSTALGDSKSIMDYAKSGEGKEPFAMGALMGGGFGVIGNLDVMIRNRALEKMKDETKAEADQMREDLRQQGFSEDEIEDLVLDSFSELPEGQQAAQEAVQEVLDNISKSQQGNDPVNAEENLQPVNPDEIMTELPEDGVDPQLRTDLHDAMLNAVDTGIQNQTGQQQPDLSQLPQFSPETIPPTVAPVGVNFSPEALRQDIADQVNQMVGNTGQKRTEVNLPFAPDKIPADVLSKLEQAGFIKTGNSSAGMGQDRVDSTYFHAEHTPEREALANELNETLNPEIPVGEEQQIQNTQKNDKEYRASTHELAYQAKELLRNDTNFNHSHTSESGQKADAVVFESGGKTHVVYKYEGQNPLGPMPLEAFLKGRTPVEGAVPRSLRAEQPSVKQPKAEQPTAERKKMDQTMIQKVMQYEQNKENLSDDEKRKHLDSIVDYAKKNDIDIIPELQAEIDLVNQQKQPQTPAKQTYTAGEVNSLLAKFKAKMALGAFNKQDLENFKNDLANAKGDAEFNQVVEKWLPKDENPIKAAKEKTEQEERHNQIRKLAQRMSPEDEFKTAVETAKNKKIDETEQKYIEEYGFAPGDIVRYTKGKTEHLEESSFPAVVMKVGKSGIHPSIQIKFPIAWNGGRKFGSNTTHVEPKYLKKTTEKDLLDYVNEVNSVTEIKFKQPWEMSLKEFMADESWKMVHSGGKDTGNKSAWYTVMPNGEHYPGGYTGHGPNAKKAKEDFHQTQIYWQLRKDAASISPKAVETYKDLAIDLENWMKVRKAIAVVAPSKKVIIVDDVDNVPKSKTHELNVEEIPHHLGALRQFVANYLLVGEERKKWKTGRWKIDEIVGTAIWQKVDEAIKKEFNEGDRILFNEGDNRILGEIEKIFAGKLHVDAISKTGEKLSESYYVEWEDALSVEEGLTAPKIKREKRPKTEFPEGHPFKLGEKVRNKLNGAIGTYLGLANDGYISVEASSQQYWSIENTERATEDKPAKQAKPAAPQMSEEEEAVRQILKDNPNFGREEIQDALMYMEISMTVDEIDRIRYNLQGPVQEEAPVEKEQPSDNPFDNIASPNRGNILEAVQSYIEKNNFTEYLPFINSLSPQHAGWVNSYLDRDDVRDLLEKHEEKLNGPARKAEKEAEMNAIADNAKKVIANNNELLATIKGMEEIHRQWVSGQITGPADSFNTSEFDKRGGKGLRLDFNGGVSDETKKLMKKLGFTQESKVDPRSWTKKINIFSDVDSKLLQDQLDKDIRKIERERKKAEKEKASRYEKGKEFYIANIISISIVRVKQVKDGQVKVAKLMLDGTPNGGSDFWVPIEQADKEFFDTSKEAWAEVGRQEEEREKKHGPRFQSTEERSLQSTFKDVYFSTTGKNDEIEALNNAQPANVLIAFNHFWNQKWDSDVYEALLNKLNYQPKQVILDSGAKTFHEQGIDIGLDDLIDQYELTNENVAEVARIIDRDVEGMNWADASEMQPIFRYIKHLGNAGGIEYAFNLDTIGDNESSYLTFQLMNEIFPDSIIPVFSAVKNVNGEWVEETDYSYLEKYAEMTDYIGIGGLAIDEIKNKRNFRAEVINHITEKYPNKKFHVLGTLDKRVLEQTKNVFSSDGIAWIDRHGLFKKTGKASKAEQSASDIKRIEDNLKPRNRAEVVTQAGTKVEVRYAIVPLDDIIASHNMNGVKNPDYPQELQPRFRDAQDSKIQARNMAKNLDPDRLLDNRMASDGAPILGPDMVVESGNGRMMALETMHRLADPATAEGAPLDIKQGDYWTTINEFAKKNGHLPTDGELRKIKNPVLVRIRTDQFMGSQHRKRFVAEANESSVSSMGATETALADAKKMDSIINLFVPTESGDVNSAQNQEFIRLFINEVVPSSERREVRTAEGHLSKDGKERLERALFALAYNDRNALEKYSEDLDDNARTVTGALTDVAPKLAVLNAEIKAGSIMSEFDIAQDIVDAFNKLVELRRKGERIPQWIKEDRTQESLFDDTKLSETAYELLAQFDKVKSRKRIRAVLFNYVEYVLNDPRSQGTDLLGQSATKEEFLEIAIERADGGGDLFEIEAQTRPSQTKNNGKGAGTQEESGSGESKKKVVNPLPEDPEKVTEKQLKEYGAMMKKLYTEFMNRIDNGTFPTGTAVQKDIRKIAQDVIGRPAQEEEWIDALEAAVQLLYRQKVEPGMDVELRIDIGKDLERYLKVGGRSLEQTERQQFSTPIPLAEIVRYVANPKKGDFVKEGSAGTGSLILPLMDEVEQVQAIELSPRRAAILQSMGIDVINKSTFDVSGLKATLVVGNPPFQGENKGKGSANFTGKPPWKGGWGDLSNRFLNWDLRSLKDGDRLVYVVAGGVIDGKQNAEFRKWLKENHTVRALVKFPSGVYDTRGTKFPTGLIVVEKGKSTGYSTITGEFETLESLLDALKPLSTADVDYQKLHDERVKANKVRLPKVRAFIEQMRPLVKENGWKTAEQFLNDTDNTLADIEDMHGVESMEELETIIADLNLPFQPGDKVLYQGKEFEVTAVHAGKHFGRPQDSYELKRTVAAGVELRGATDREISPVPKLPDFNNPDYNPVPDIMDEVMKDDKPKGKAAWRNKQFAEGEIVMTEHHGEGKVISIGKYQDTLDIRLTSNNKTAFDYPAESTFKVGESDEVSFKVGDRVHSAARGEGHGTITRISGSSAEVKFDSFEEGHTRLKDLEDLKPSDKPAPAGKKAPAPKKQPNKYDKGRDISARAAEAARKRLKERHKGNTTLYSGLPMDDLIDYAIIGWDKLNQKTMDMAEFTENMVKEFGESIRDWMPAIYGQSLAMTTYEPERIEKMLQQAYNDDDMKLVDDEETVDSPESFESEGTEFSITRTMRVKKQDYEVISDEDGEGWRVRHSKSMSVRIYKHKEDPNIIDAKKGHYTLHGFFPNPHWTEYMLPTAEFEKLLEGKPFTIYIENEEVAQIFDKVAVEYDELELLESTGTDKRTGNRDEDAEVEGQKTSSTSGSGSRGGRTGNRGSSGTGSSGTRNESDADSRQDAGSNGSTSRNEETEDIPETVSGEIVEANSGNTGRTRKEVGNGPSDNNQSSDFGYVPGRVVTGAAHRGNVTEAPNMRFVSLPEEIFKNDKYLPHPKVIKGGEYVLSDIQMETVMAAKYNFIEHDKRGILIADDTGMGKTAQQLGILADSYLSGRTKRILVVTTKDTVAVSSFLPENQKFDFNIPMEWIGTDSPYMKQHGNTFKDAAFNEGKKYKEFQVGDGVIVMSKTTFRDSQESIIKWLNEADGDVMIMMDESHEFANRESGLGKANVRIYNEFRGKAQFVYASATAAEDIAGLEHLYGLNLWSTDGFGTFQNRLTSADTTARSGGKRKTGMAAAFDKSGKSPFKREIPLTMMEQITRELKMEGQYIGRQLSMEGVTMEGLEIKVSPKEMGDWNRAVQFVGMIAQKAEMYGRNSDGLNPKARGQIISQVVGYMRRLSGYYRLKAVIKDIQKQMEEGTFERFGIIAEFKTGDDGKPANLMAAINAINDQEEVDNGTDVEIFEIPEARDDKQALFAILQGLNPEWGPNPVPDIPSPMSMLYDAFGEENVAVVSGDTKAKDRPRVVSEFQQNKKNIIWFNSAGGTGVNMHDTIGIPIRVYTQDYPYNAKAQKQAEGRFNRTGQVTTPTYVYPYLNSSTDTKFVGTLLARYEAMGALSRGDTGKLGGDELSNFDFTGEAAELASYEIIPELDQEDLAQMFGEFTREVNFYNEEGALDETAVRSVYSGNSPEVKKFLNALMFLEFEPSSRVFNQFTEKVQEIQKRLEEAGGVKDKFETFQGKELDTQVGKNGIKLRRIQTILTKNQQKQLDAALKLAVENEEAMAEEYEQTQAKTQVKLEEEVDKIQVKQKEEKDELQEVKDRLADAMRDMNSKKMEHSDYLKLRERSEKKMRQMELAIYNRESRLKEAKNKLKGLKDGKVDIIETIPDMRRAQVRVNNARLFRMGAEANIERSKEVMLVDGRIATNGLLVNIRSAIRKAAKRIYGENSVPAAALTLELRGYTLENGERALGAVVPKWAEGDVAEALEARMAYTGTNDDVEGIKAHLKAGNKVSLQDGFELEWQPKLQQFRILGMKVSQHRELFKSINDGKADLGFHSVSQSFVILTDDGFRKMIERFPILAKETKKAEPEASENVTPPGDRTIKGVNVSVETSKHTKTGEDIWLVKPLEDIDKADYGEFAGHMKKFGGRYYNKKSPFAQFRGKFVFQKNPEGVFDKKMEEQLHDRINSRVRSGDEMGIMPNLPFMNTRRPQKDRKYAMEDTEIQGRIDAADNIPQEGVVKKVKEYLGSLKNRLTREFEHLPNTGNFSQIRHRLLQLEKQRGIAMEKTARNLQALLIDLDKDQYELYKNYVLLADLKQELDAEHALAFGFTPEKLLKEFERAEAFLAGEPKVQESLDLRKRLWDDIKRDYIKAFEKIGVNVRDKFTKDDYYRHIVIQKQIENSQSAAQISAAKALKTPKGKGYMKKRHGSELDYVTDYLLAESEVMSNMLFDLEVANTIALVDKNHNIEKRIKQEVDKQNLKSYDKMIATERKQHEREAALKGMGYSEDEITAQIAKENFLPKRVKDVIEHYITEYKLRLGNKHETLIESVEAGIRQRVGWAYSELKALANEGELWEGKDGEYAYIVQLLSDDTSSVGKEDMFAYLADLAAQDHEGAKWAGMYLKYNRLKPAFMKDIIGEEDFKTVLNSIPEGYTVWRPDDSNLFIKQNTLSDYLAERLFNGTLDELTEGDFSQQLVLAGKKKGYIIETELAATLDHLMDVPKFNTLKKAMQSLKQVLLIGPVNVFKYNARNMTGDLDKTIAGNPGALNPVLLGKAYKELNEVFFRNRAPGKEMKEWMERGGLQTLIQSQEFGDMKHLRIFKDKIVQKELNLLQKTVNVPKNVWDFYWNTARKLTDHREALLRYANFLSYLEQVEKGNGKPKNYGASIRAEIDALANNYDKAFNLSNDLLIAYDKTSAKGRELRDTWFPFWSFIEGNLRSYTRLFKNAYHDEELASAVGRKLLSTAVVKSPLLAYRTGKLALQVSFVTGALALWNALLFGDEEEELPEHVQKSVHIILGRNKDGDVVYFNRLGTLEDFLEWFGIDDLNHDMKDYLNNERTFLEIIGANAVKPANKAVQALNPMLKQATEQVFGVKLFPDFMNPTRIHDRVEHFASLFTANKEYAALRDELVDRPAKEHKFLSNWVSYSADVEETNYYKVKDMQAKAAEKYLDKVTGGIGNKPTPKSKALYEVKVGMKFGDLEYSKKWYDEYVARGGTIRGLEQSLRSLHPLSDIPKDYRDEYYDMLSEAEQEKVDQAMEYYKKVLLADTKIVE